MTVYTLAATFSRGEFSPRLHGRPDIQDYAQALQTCKNWLVMRQGGLTRRPGFVWINNVRDNTRLSRLIEFEFNEEQAYALLFNGSGGGTAAIRFYTLGGVVTLTAQNITGITQANPAVVTYTGADYTNNTRVWIDGVVGMPEVNNREFTVQNVNAGANTFELFSPVTSANVNSTGYGAYVSGGSVAAFYEIGSPYGDTELFDIQNAQRGDTVYLAHPSYAPRKLIRSSETSWAISQINFDDGPYLDEATQGVTLTPARTGAVHPIMSGLTAPSGTAANSDADADAWEIFDADPVTTVDIAAATGHFSFDLGIGVSKVPDAYWIRSGSTLGNAPSGWRFQVSTDASTWITIDTRTNETVWGRNEARFYEFENTQAYRAFRLLVDNVDGGSGLQIAGMGIHEAGDGQTAFNLTASAVTGINGGAGWAASDVGRTIRLLDVDNSWRWARIVAVTNTTVVTVRIYGHSLSSLTAILHWKLSAWSAYDGYPASVGFYDDRLGWGGASGSPLKIALSKPGSYEDHGTSDPADDTDAIYVEMTGGRLNRIGFMEEMDPLVVGTPGTMRIVGPLDGGAPFSNTNIKQKANGTYGAAAIQPLVIGNTMLYIDRYTKRIYEFAFDLNSNAFVPRELSIESDHLLASGILECSFQQDPDNLCWYPLGNGRVAVLTYEQAQRIAGFVDVRVAGGGSADAVVESTASIPSAGGDVTYAVVKRTINAATVRSVEYLAPPFETGDTLAEAIYADSAGYYAGSATNVVYGINWLIGESVGILADGIDIGDATVSAAGTLTLPNSVTATKIVWGKRITSRAVTLRAPSSGNQDGTALGRRMIVNEAKIDMLNAGGMEAGVIIDGTDVLEVYPAANDARVAAAGALNTGMFGNLQTDRHENNGVFVIQNDSMYPATIRALELALEGEP